MIPKVVEYLEINQYHPSHLNIKGKMYDINLRDSNKVFDDIPIHNRNT